MSRYRETEKKEGGERELTRPQALTQATAIASNTIGRRELPPCHHAARDQNGRTIIRLTYLLNPT